MVTLEQRRRKGKNPPGKGKEGKAEAAAAAAAGAAAADVHCELLGEERGDGRGPHETVRVYFETINCGVG